MSHRHNCPDAPGPCTGASLPVCCLWEHGDCPCDFVNMCRPRPKAKAVV